VKEKLKNKLMSVILSPVQFHYHEGNPMSKEVKLTLKEFVEKVGFEPRVRVEE